MHVDITKVKHEEAIAFLEQFLTNRGVIFEFYKHVPEDKMNYRMVDTKTRKSDSPRESLIHLIAITREYSNGIKNGTLVFGGIDSDVKKLKKATKKELIEKLNAVTQELVDLLTDSSFAKKVVKVAWFAEPIPAIASLWGLNSHEILQTGWNLAVMDHLNIERFQQLKDIWG